MVDESNEQVYMRILYTLRNIIKNEYRNGGRLPSSREMCERINVNRMTYNKAMSCLIADGTVINGKQRGVFVIPYKQRCKKIGIVLGGGVDSPFVMAQKWLAQAINEFADNAFNAQIIQASQRETILTKAMVHGVSGLLWFATYSSDRGVPKDIAKANLIPMVFANYIDPVSDECLNTDPMVCVMNNLQTLGSKRADFFIEQKHSRVIYVGNYWFAKYNGFVDKLNAAGIEFNEDCCLKSREEVERNLADLLADNSVSGIFSEGGIDLQNSVMQVLSSRAKKIKLPQIVLRKSYNMQENFKDYSIVKNVYIEDSIGAGGAVAARMLMDNIDNGTSLVSIQVEPNYSLKKYKK